MSLASWEIHPQAEAPLASVWLQEVPGSLTHDAAADAPRVNTIFV